MSLGYCRLCVGPQRRPVRGQRQGWVPLHLAWVGRTANEARATIRRMEQGGGLDNGHPSEARRKQAMRRLFIDHIRQDQIGLAGSLMDLACYRLGGRSL